MSSPMPHPISPENAMQIAAYFRVLSDPVRLRLLDAMRDGEMTVMQLTDTLDCTQQNVSKHLAVLRESGMVGVRRDGNRSWHSIIDESVFDLCAAVCGPEASVDTGAAQAAAG